MWLACYMMMSSTMQVCTGATHNRSLHSVQSTFHAGVGTRQHGMEPVGIAALHVNAFVCRRRQ